MMKQFLAIAAGSVALMSAPALADDARTPPPTEPYFAPKVTTCEALHLKIYFKPDTAELTPFARDAIRQAGDQLSGCAVTRLSAVAVAGDLMTETPTLTLADDRRETVLKELTAHGIQSADMAIETDLGNSVMSRNVDIQLETVPATVG